MTFIIFRKNYDWGRSGGITGIVERIGYICRRNDQCYHCGVSAVRSASIARGSGYFHLLCAPEDPCRPYSGSASSQKKEKAFLY